MTTILILTLLCSLKEARFQIDWILTYHFPSLPITIDYLARLSRAAKLRKPGINSLMDDSREMQKNKPAAQAALQPQPLQTQTLPDATPQIG